MALKKEIELSNGIVLKYHRIVSINKITNNSIIIEVGSYISEQQRQKEIEYYASNEVDKKMDVFIKTTYVSKDYDEQENIEECYDFLKTTEEFKGAENA